MLQNISSKIVQRAQFVRFNWIPECTLNDYLQLGLNYKNACHNIEHMQHTKCHTFPFALAFFGWKNWGSDVVDRWLGIQINVYCRKHPSERGPA